MSELPVTLLWACGGILYAYGGSGPPKRLDKDCEEARPGGRCGGPSPPPFPDNLPLSDYAQIDAQGH
jgi:hypothetical protein